MTNKELYDEAVECGLRFRYFKGEEECPFENDPKASYWESEMMAAINDPENVIDDFSGIDEKDIPEFIKISNATEAEKATAHAAHNWFLNSLPAPIVVKNFSLGPFGDYFED